MGYYTNLSHAKWAGDIDKYCNSLAEAMNYEDYEFSLSDFKYDYKSRIGFAGGIFVYYQLYKSLYVQSEVSFLMKGVVINGTGTFTDHTTWYGTTYTVYHDEYMKLNYFEVPLLAKLYVFDKQNSLQGYRAFNVYFITGQVGVLHYQKK